ncbi:caspase domain-containing protein [Mycena crocata]|nr:caspase domain-containing protein [Mycena crocata]
MATMYTGAHNWDAADVPPTPSSSTSSPTAHSRSGRRKALLIGIRGTANASADYPELKGSHQDVAEVRELLVDCYGYTPHDITILVDDGVQEHTQPTRKNILQAIRDLVKDARAGDRFCFHYCGHSTQIQGRKETEEDGMDECIIPIDSDGKTNLIVDNELHATLVAPLPLGTHLVAVLDTCHSGSLLDLPHSRCNRVFVPWIERVRHASGEARYRVARANARLVSLRFKPFSPNTRTRNDQAESSRQSELEAVQSPSSSRAATRRAPTLLLARRSEIALTLVGTADPVEHHEPGARAASESLNRTETKSGSKRQPRRTVTYCASTSASAKEMRKLSAGQKENLDGDSEARMQKRTLSAKARKGLKLVIPGASGKGKEKESHASTTTEKNMAKALDALPGTFWEDARQTTSPVAMFCAGWCRDLADFRMPGRDGESAGHEITETVDENTETVGDVRQTDNEHGTEKGGNRRDGDVKADVLSLASCEDAQITWEDEQGRSMTSALVQILRRDPTQSVQEVLVQISHAMYNKAFTRHASARAYKARRTSMAKRAERELARLERNTDASKSAPTSPRAPAPAHNADAPVPKSRRVSVPSKLHINTATQNKGMTPTPQKTQTSTPTTPRTPATSRLQTIARLKALAVNMRQSAGFDMDAIESSELASGRPVDMRRQWRM